MNSVYLLTGSNEGDRLQQLNTCCEQLNLLAGTVVEASKIYETAAWGIEDLPPHYNQALHLHTTLSPLALLDVLQDIENTLGRKRAVRWGLRTIDIDIIYYNNQIVALPNLIIPHPLMQERNFVLAPLCEIAEDFIHPVLMKSNKELLVHSKDMLAVSPLLPQA